MKRRIVMSMLAGATLLAGTLLGATPAQPAEAPSAVAQSADLPAEFGTDWHDPHRGTTRRQALWQVLPTHRR